MVMKSRSCRCCLSVVVLFVAGCLFGGCTSAPTGTSDLAVDRVVLYQSGVAYVERSGEASGEDLVLRVRPDQINDVLSSLVVIDRDTGAPATVSLPARASEPEQSAIAEVAGEKGMEAFLESLRGADVRIHHDGSRTRGRVLAVESSPPRLSLLVDGQSTRFIDLGSIDEVELENEAVALRVRQSLDESMSADDWQSVEITLRFPSSESRRNLVVAWVVEAPLWKPTYRVLMEGDDIVLQGWALVDNLSGEDWRDIELSLASGTPLSFRFDLHSPIEVDRPDMSGYGVPQAVDLRPPDPMRARPQPEPSPQDQAEERSGIDLSGESFGRVGGLGMVEPEPSADSDDRVASAGSGADVEQLDALFRFDITGQVTLPDRSSTLVTLVNESVDGQDMLVFQPGSGASENHPYRSLLLENSTDAPIQRSPVAIYRDGAFVGEGITPHISPAERAVLPYAIESRVHVSRDHITSYGESSLTGVEDGELKIQHDRHRVWRFELASSLSEDDTLYVQVPRYEEFELIVDDELDVRREDDFYLVPVDLVAGTERSEEIVQAGPVSKSIEIFHSEAPVLLKEALERPDIEPDVARDLQAVLEALEETRKLEQALSDDRQLRSDIRERSKELRENLQALGDGDQHQELRGELAGRLQEQDELMAEVAARVVENSEKRSALRIEIQELMRTLSL